MNQNLYVQSVNQKHPSEYVNSASVKQTLATDIPQTLLPKSIGRQCISQWGPETICRIWNKKKLLFIALQTSYSNWKTNLAAIDLSGTICWLWNGIVLRSAWDPSIQSRCNNLFSPLWFPKKLYFAVLWKFDDYLGNDIFSSDDTLYHVPIGKVPKFVCFFY